MQDILGTFSSDLDYAQRILLPHKIEVTSYTMEIFQTCSTLHGERDGLGKI